METIYEVNDSMRSEAWDAAQRVRLLAASHQKVIEEALKRYFEERGAYPQSLAEIGDRLPEDTRAVLEGFWYAKKSDSEYELDDRIIG